MICYYILQMFTFRFQVVIFHLPGHFSYAYILWLLLPIANYRWVCQLNLPRKRKIILRNLVWRFILVRLQWAMMERYCVLMMVAALVQGM